jgi:hypothetical protein
MEVSEQREIRMEQRILPLDRLLDLEEQLAVAPHPLGIGDESRPDQRVGVVGEARADARSGLDEHFVPERRQLARARGRQRHPPLGLLDLRHDTDPHPVISIICCNLTLVIARLAARPLVGHRVARASSAPAPAVSTATATATGPAD